MRVEHFIGPRTTVNTFLLIDEERKAAVVIDPGERASSMEALIAEEGLVLEDIVLTHGHVDHFGYAEAYRKQYGAAIWAPEKEKPLLEDSDLNLSVQLLGAAQTLLCDHYFKEGDRVSTMDLTVMETPGHTAGSVIFLSGSWMFSGDTLFQGSCGRWDLPTGGMHVLFRSLARIFELEGDYQVLPGHGPATRLSEERAHSPMNRYITLQKQWDKKKAEEAKNGKH